MKTTLALTLAGLLLMSSKSFAADISTHVLDLASGVGGKGVSVSLFKKSDNNDWTELAQAVTDENGRIKKFEEEANYETRTYKLVFDMSSYEMSSSDPFFPEIN